MIGMGNDSSCGGIAIQSGPAAIPLIFEGLRIHPPNPMEGHVSALIRRKRVTGRRR